MSASPLEHRDPRRRIRRADDCELLDVHGRVVLLESLELDLRSRLLRDELIGPSTDRLCGKAVLSDLFVIIRRDDPSGAADIGGTDQPREVQERSLELELNRAL